MKLEIQSLPFHKSYGYYLWETNWELMSTTPPIPLDIEASALFDLLRKDKEIYSNNPWPKGSA